MYMMLWTANTNRCNQFILGLLQERRALERKVSELEEELKVKSF